MTIQRGYSLKIGSGESGVESRSEVFSSLGVEIFSSLREAARSASTGLPPSIVRSAIYASKYL